MNIPITISLAFILLSFTTVFLFYMASRRNKKVLLVTLLYAILQGLLAYFGFYAVKPILPAQFFLIVFPSFAFVFYLYFSKKGKVFIHTLDIKILTLLHTIRIGAELILFALYSCHAIPEVMTFAGRNFDILAGLSAPIIYYLAFVKGIIGKKGLLVWNSISLLLLINIVVHAVLSVELPFQQFGFDQPNEAILHFPFVWLPAIVVPLVILAHLTAMKQLLKKQ